MQGGEATHGQSDDMGPVDAEPVEDAANIGAGAGLGVGGQVRRHVRRREAARGEGDAEVEGRQGANLRLPAAGVAGEVREEDDARHGTGTLVTEVDDRGGCDGGAGWAPWHRGAE